VAPSIGDQRIRPVGDFSWVGICCQAVLKPNGAPHADVSDRGHEPPLPPLPRWRFHLGLGRDALAQRADRPEDRKPALGGHLLHRRVVAHDRDPLAHARGVVAKELEVESALSDARAHRQHEHGVVAAIPAKTFYELGDLLLGLDVDWIGCHIV